MRQGAGWLSLGLLLCGFRAAQTTLDPAADQAAQSDVVWRTMLAVCGLMYLLVMAFLAWALLKASRRRAEVPPAVGHTAAEPALERGLAGWGALILAGLVGLTTVSFLVDRTLAEVGRDPLKIKVTANQWWWQADYEGATPSEQFSTANELHLPVNRTAVIELHAGDVIHSFWAPNLGGKEDLIPGRTNYLRLTPRRTGVFRAQCAEFCGLQHAKMALTITVDRPADFEAWRRHQLGTPPAPSNAEAQAGQHLFHTRACVMCHRVGGTDAGATVGPDLSHIASRPTLAAGTLPNTPEALAGWITDPQGLKPGASMPKVSLSGPELSAVVAYLETLK
jgi:cytochrome c oxidase subunit 2